MWQVSFISILYQPFFAIRLSATIEGKPLPTELPKDESNSMKSSGSGSNLDSQAKVILILYHNSSYSHCNINDLPLSLV